MSQNPSRLATMQARLQPQQNALSNWQADTTRAHGRVRVARLFALLAACTVMAASVHRVAAQSSPPATGTPATLDAPAAPEATKPPVATPEEPQSSTQPQAAAAADNVAAPLPEALAAKIQRIQELNKVVSDLTAEIDTAKIDDAELSKLRPRFLTLAGEAQDVGADLRPRLANINAQIEKLGAKPAGSAPAEAAEITSEREDLQRRATVLDGAIRSAELIAERAKQQSARIQNLREDNFANQLLNPTERSPLNPATWRDVANAFPDATSQTGAMFADIAARARFVIPWILVVIGAALAVYGILRQVRTWLLARREERYQQVAPNFLERATAAGWSAPAFAIPAAGAASVLYLGLDSLNLFYLQTGKVAAAAFSAFLIYICVTALARAFLAPNRPRWRVIKLTDEAAKKLFWTLLGLATVHALDLFLNEVSNALYLPFPVSIAQAFVASLAIAALIFAIVRTPMVLEHDAGAAPVTAMSWYPRWLKIPLAVAALAIAACALFGYVALARFIANHVILTGSIAVLVILLHLAIRSICRTTIESETSYSSADLPDGDEVEALDATQQSLARAVPRFLQLSFGLQGGQLELVTRIISVIFNVGLAAVAIPLFLYSFGFTTTDILAWMRGAVFGFEVGGVHISATRILTAVGLFVAVLFATRVLQRWLKSTLLHPNRTDPGIAHSVSTGIGYAGFAIAALTAVAYGGFDITNFAIVAGALSVGIGFGLQSIVNNFVSGLILLVERPIKVGDWIRVSDQQGHVRRISVRSTEIETFDRASVIIPNSDLISGTVMNLTHRNALGRIIIPVGVSYDADPVQVREILQGIADECPIILRQPPPLIAFENLGDSALEFTMRVYIADVNKSLSTQTELRTSIVQEFRKAGIEIPYPQSDVHLRDLDGVKQFAMKLIEERARQKAAQQPSVSDPSPGTPATTTPDKPVRRKPAAKAGKPKPSGHDADGSAGDSGGGDGGE